MISKYLQKEDTLILEGSRIGNRLGHQAARFWPAEAETRNLRKPASWGAIRFHRKGPARIVRYSQGRAQLGGFALSQAGGPQPGTTLPDLEESSRSRVHENHSRLSKNWRDESLIRAAMADARCVTHFKRRPPSALDPGSRHPAGEPACSRPSYPLHRTRAPERADLRADRMRHVAHIHAQGWTAFLSLAGPRFSSGSAAGSPSMGSAGRDGTI
jgi:hypothetical protein